MAVNKISESLGGAEMSKANIERMILFLPDIGESITLDKLHQGFPPGTNHQEEIPQKKTSE